jgi:hypothetical protein
MRKPKTTKAAERAVVQHVLAAFLFVRLRRAKNGTGARATEAAQQIAP